jgi:hypothetical protein
LGWSTVNYAPAMGAEATVEQTEVSDDMRLARYCMLDETSGLVLGILTVTWILMSRTGLAL